jgi:hypothetical protein
VCVCVLRHLISSRISRHIDNLSLLHESKEEAQIDQLQLLAQYGKEGETMAEDGSFNDHFDLLGGDDAYNIK